MSVKDLKWFTFLQRRETGRVVHIHTPVCGPQSRATPHGGLLRVSAAHRCRGTSLHPGARVTAKLKWLSLVTAKLKWLSLVTAKLKWLLLCPVSWGIAPSWCKSNC